MKMKWIFLLVMMLMLSGCGFRPRGEIPLAPQLHRLYLKASDPYGQLVRNLKLDLKSSGARFVCSPQHADVILDIISEETSQQLLSVSGTQQTRQYNLILTVVFQITDPQGTVLIPPQTVRETRTIPIQTNQVLAGSNEANNLYRQMRVAIVYDVINRLASNEVTHILMTHT